MRPDIVRDLPGKSALLVKEQLETVQHNPDELDHLKRGHVLLPPDVLLVLGPHGRQEIVSVHEHVNKCVEEAKEGGVAAGNPAGAWPHGERHDPMVDNMEQGDVGELLTGHKTELE